MGVNVYSIEKMRVITPKGRVAEKNPDRAMTVRGEFHSVVDGKVNPEPLTFSQKDIDWDTAGHPDFDIDPVAGTLTLPAGERGRKASVGIDADSVLAILAEARARKAAPAEDAEEDAEAETETAS